jgi:hypothetical protein
MVNRRFIGALTLSIAFTMLADCGRSQPPIGAPGAIPQSSALIQHAANGKSWMLPEAKKNTLLYVSSPGRNLVNIFTYPGGRLVGSLTGIPYPYGLCSDKRGDVFVVSWSSESGPGSIIEYAHAASQPTVTLTDGDYTPAQCSVDPNTGNLAAGNLNFNIAVWANAQGSPTYYSTLGFIEENWTITYDANGDLYFASLRYRKGQAWLPQGSSGVARFDVPKNGLYRYGQYLTIRAKAKSGATVARYALSGSRGSKIGYMKINGCYGLREYAIKGSTLVAACSSSVAFFKYPAGGNPTNTISGLDDPYGVAISLASC